MPGGISEAWRTVDGGQGPNVSAIEKKLGEIADAAKLKATAQAVGALIRDDDTPSKNDVDVADKTLLMAARMADMESDKVKAAREEAEALRHRVAELEERTREGKREERREQLDTFGVLTQVMGQNQQMMMQMLADRAERETALLEKIADLSSRRDDPQTDFLRQIGQQAVLGRLNSDPDEELERHLKVAERLGYKRPQDADPSGVINLDAVRAKHAMTIEERRLALEEAKLTREMDRLDKVALGEVQAKTKQADALAQGLAAFGKAVGGRAAPGQPQEAPPPPRRPVPYECSNCHTVTATEREDRFACSNPDCGQIVYITAPPEGTDG